MRIFNVGIREILLLMLILLILFGPRQLQENARKLARSIRSFLRSDAWRSFLGVYDDVNNIKDQVIRESGIQEVRDSLRGINRQLDDLDDQIRRSDLSTDMPRPEIPHPETEQSPNRDHTDEPKHPAA